MMAAARQLLSETNTGAAINDAKDATSNKNTGNTDDDDADDERNQSYNQYGYRTSEPNPDSNHGHYYCLTDGKPKSKACEIY
ncbi:hypothetical protein Pint_24321 [Pistacia integerrima]|uniref:Uncharacterized protein n=1 Tax=Pistacia integerrima TaxID=434235 RepID=A0ACC0YF85_9ROSI|nr:hypothetical protein Pint_24321 [Pistacia integerrima]